jgi:hypothetical protein
LIKNQKNVNANNKQLLKYLHKYYLKPYLSKKILIKRTLLKIFKKNKTPFLKKKLIYSPIYKTINLEFNTTIKFNAYQNYYKWVKIKFINKKYHQIIKIIKKKNYLIKKNNSFSKLFINKKRTLILNFLYTYVFFFNYAAIDTFYYLKKIKIKTHRALYYLIFSFKNNKLFVNFLNIKKKKLFFFI